MQGSAQVLIIFGRAWDPPSQPDVFDQTAGLRTAAPPFCHPMPEPRINELQEAAAATASATTPEVIRIADPDAPISRIFPVWAFEETLRQRRLVLVEPAAWEDPYEVVGRAIAVSRRGASGYTQVIINQSLPPVFAQCWSATPESDTLLRAYSRVTNDPRFGRNMFPRDEGVRVTSTPRKLLRVLTEGTKGAPAGSCFVGAVRYLPASGVLQDIANAVSQFGLNVFTKPSNRAELLLLKRDAFAHENEVRLIYVRHNDDPPDTTLGVQIDPHDIFDEVTFDPRLQSFERREREEAARALGYSGRFAESTLYQGILLEILIDEN